MASASDDFDLDSFLEQQSSDDDGSDLPRLNRSLEDILNDSEEELSSDSSEDDATKRFLFRNHSFTHQRQENDENMGWTDKALKKTKKVEGNSSSFPTADKLKIRYDKGISSDSDASNSNLEKNGKPLHSIESKAQKTKVDAYGSNLHERGKPLHPIDNLD